MPRRSVIMCRECGARAKIKSTKYDQSVPDFKYAILPLLQSYVQSRICNESRI